MITVGVDFAAQPKGTAIARVAWHAGVAQLKSIVSPATDRDIVETLPDADAIGIDVPFGWPDAFFEFLANHRDSALEPVTGEADEWRRSLAYRLTDRTIAREHGKWPLSVASDRIALPAMRAAGLLAMLRERGEVVDRAGGSRITEVYPGLALRIWKVCSFSYKGANASRLPEAVECLQVAAPWLDLGEWEPLCRANADAFDAVVASLVARAHALGHWVRPTSDELAQAQREGWIIVPTCALGALVG